MPHPQPPRPLQRRRGRIMGGLCAAAIAVLVGGLRTASTPGDSQAPALTHSGGCRNEAASASDPSASP